MAKGRRVEIGQRFGRGVVIEAGIRVPRAGRASGTPGARMRCDCGAAYECAVAMLIDGHRKSCGCLKSDMSRSNGRLREETHGLTHHELYGTWTGMIHRCEDPRWYAFHRYGGRGIKVCDRWHDVSLFIGDLETAIGPRPAGHTLDRINNDGNYEPGNVRWATQSEQMRNRQIPPPPDRGVDGRFLPAAAL